MTYYGSSLHKRSFVRSDFSYCVKQFEQLADDFAKTDVRFMQRDGHTIPLLTTKDWGTFHVLFRKTLLNVLNYLVQSQVIRFNKYEDCGIFCEFVFASKMYESLGLDSPKCILMMRCGMFAGSYRLEPKVQYERFNLSYAGVLRSVAFHCVAAYVPTLNGSLNKTINLAPRVVDVLTDSNDSQSSHAKTLAEYVSLRCAIAPGGAQVLMQRLHCEVLVEEEDPSQTFDLAQPTGIGDSACMLALFTTKSSSYSKLKSLSRELNSQFTVAVRA
jgi:hypothetical protein